MPPKAASKTAKTPASKGGTAAKPAKSVAPKSTAKAPSKAADTPKPGQCRRFSWQVWSLIMTSIHDSSEEFKSKCVIHTCRLRGGFRGWGLHSIIIELCRVVNIITTHNKSSRDWSDFKVFSLERVFPIQSILLQVAIGETGRSLKVFFLSRRFSRKHIDFSVSGPNTYTSHIQSYLRVSTW